MLSKPLNRHEYNSSQVIEENIINNINEQSPSEELLNNYDDFLQNKQENKEYAYSLNNELEKKIGNNKQENDEQIIYKGTFILNSQKDHNKSQNLDSPYGENIQEENINFYSESSKLSENLNPTNENTLTVESKGIEEKKIFNSESYPLPKVSFYGNKKCSPHQELFKNEEENAEKIIIWEEKENSVFCEKKEDKTLLGTKREKSSTENKRRKNKKRKDVYNDLNDNSCSLISKLYEDNSLSDIEEEIKSNEENDAFNSKKEFPHKIKCNNEKYNEQDMINEQDAISDEGIFTSVEANSTNFGTDE